MTASKAFRARAWAVRSPVLQCFDERRTQSLYPPNVAFGGVNALFFSPPVHGLPGPTHRPIVAELTTGSPSAARRTRNSSRLASGYQRRQATTSARLDAFRHGAGAPRKGRGATAPIVRPSC